MRSAFLVLSLLTVALAVDAGTLPRIALHRMSGGVAVQAIAFQDDFGTHSAFAPQAYVSYSLTNPTARFSPASLAATLEVLPADDLWIARAGGRMGLYESGRFLLGAGFNLVRYSGDGSTGIAEPTSWEASVNGDWWIVRSDLGRTQLSGSGSAAWDPENARTVYRLALKAPLFGGKL